jgi:Cu-Zn family superoxide dismutase
MNMLEHRPMIAVLALALGAGGLGVGSAGAATVSATVHLATPNGPSAEIGTVSITDSPAGAVFTPQLRDLPPGPHGFHLHAKGDCAASVGADGKVVPAGAAGDHWDPDNTGKHLGPEGSGHLGDLPVLDVAPDGTATAPVVAPRIEDVTKLEGHALMIHAGGDTYGEPPPTGGGGARLACGVIE